MKNFTYHTLAVLFLCTFGVLLSSNTFAQSKISGKVTDAKNGETLPGVSISVKGTQKGAITDINGEYSLTVNKGETTLVFSLVGYTLQEVEIGNRSTIDFAMKVDDKVLSELVVVGYGVQKKETVSGSVSTVKGDQLVKSPVVNLSNSIAGRLAGVVAVNRSGEPGFDGSAIRIRGANTLNNGDALIVVDGIPNRAGGLDRINPNDVESISVLKDASAAIYGSRAANGVILITTKRGKSGKPQFVYSANQGFSQPTVIPKLTNAAQYVSMLNDLDIYGLPVSQWAAANQAYKTTGVYTGPTGTIRKAPFSPTDIQKYSDGSDPWLYPNTDWYKATLNEWAPQSQHNLQVSGGTENIKYLASIGYQNQDGYYKHTATAYQQYDMRLNLDAKINNSINLNIGILAREEARNFPTRGAGAIFRMQMRGKPQEQAYWPNGLPGPDIENGENPVVITTNLSGYDRQKQDYLQTNGALDIKIPGIEGLKFTATAAIDKRLGTRKLWQIPWTLYQKGVGFEADGTTPKLIASKRGPSEPRLDQSYDDQLNILLGGVLSYERQFGDHGVTFLAGTNKETIKGNNFNAFRRYFISSALDQIFAGGDVEKNNGGGGFETARLNYFGRVAYNLKSKYLLEFLWRYDGSDRFPAATRYGFFPGVMGGWILSEEKFLKSLNFVNFLKLRGSWGQMGNDQVNLPNSSTAATYQYLSTYGFRSYILGDAEQKTLFETRLPNENITWEVASNANLGLEGQLFKGKINFEFDVFSNNRSKILWFKNASVPQSTGITLPAQNIGEVSNKGFDITLGYNGKIGSSFTYTVGVNGGYAKNRIEFWDEAPGAPEWQRTTGRPINTYISYIYDGVFKDQADIDARKLDYTAIVKEIRPGDMKYKDYNGDGKITPDDQVRNDFTQLPMFQGGINISAQYKDFDLTILFQGAAGAKQYVSAGEMGNIGNYLLDIYENRWTIDNPSSVHPRIANRSDQYYSNNNTYWLRSTDYIRLKNFEIGYSLPQKWGSKVGIKNLRVYASGINILTFDKLKVFDPETSNSQGQYYPQSKIINFGANVKF